MVDTISRPDSKGARTQYRNGAGRRVHNGALTGAQKKTASERQRWEETVVAKSLTRLPERGGPEAFTTISDEQVNRLYTPADLAGFDYERDLGFPGEYPFTRGVHPTMYRSRYWTMRMFAGFGSAEDTNARFRYLLDHGETGLSTAFDFPTLYGVDADDPIALGRVRQGGRGRVVAGRHGNSVRRHPD